MKMNYYVMNHPNMFKHKHEKKQGCELILKEY
jgi:hypothetical protein